MMDFYGAMDPKMAQALVKEIQLIRGCMQGLTREIRELRTENKALRASVETLKPGMLAIAGGIAEARVEKMGEAGVVPAEDGSAMTVDEALKSGELSIRAANALKRNGILRMADLLYTDAKGLRRVRNIGKETASEIIALARRLGINIAESGGGAREYKDIKPGDAVMSLYSAEDRNVTRGAAFIVESVYGPDRHRPLPSYLCGGDTPGRSVHFSVSEVAKI